MKRALHKVWNQATGIVHMQKKTVPCQSELCVACIKAISRNAKPIGIYQCLQLELFLAHSGDFPTL